jgi:hypothetical protein
MKSVCLALSLFSSLISYSQTSIPLSFTVHERSSIQFGEQWDMEYTPLRTPMKVSFDGKKLKMIHESGTVFMEAEVAEFKRKEEKKNDKLEVEAFILTITKREFIIYIIIEKKYTYDSVMWQVKVPFISDTGETISYSYFRDA